MALIDEIREQPDVAARFLDRQLGRVERTAAAMASSQPAVALIAARGSSDHAAIYAQYALGLRNRLVVALASPSMFSLYGAPPRLERAAVIGISQSGASPDIVAVLEEGRRQGAPTVAITNDGASPLAAAADHVIELEAGAERAVAATKTYSAELLAVAALSWALRGSDPAERAALDRLPAAIAAGLDRSADAAAVARASARFDRAIVLGRGYEYANAREWALKLQELAQVMAHAWSGADFEHGPLALLEPGVLVLGVLADDPAGAELLALLGRIAADGVAPIVVSDRAGSVPGHRIGRPGPASAELPSWLAPIASIVPAQLYAYHLARARGLDTERPRAIAKITRTR